MSSGLPKRRWPHGRAAVVAGSLLITVGIAGLVWLGMIVKDAQDRGDHIRRSGVPVTATVEGAPNRGMTGFSYDVTYRYDGDTYEGAFTSAESGLESVRIWVDSDDPEVFASAHGSSSDEDVWPLLSAVVLSLPPLVYGTAAVIIGKGDLRNRHRDTGHSG